MHRYYNFNPRLREGGDNYANGRDDSPVNFNPRLREGGDNDNYSYGTSFRDFNPRLREGGDVLIIYAPATPIISIHASEKEATERNH